MSLLSLFQRLFSRLFPSGPILVSGEGPVAAALHDRLQRDGRAVRRLDPGALTASKLGQAETLILADPPDTAAALAGEELLSFPGRPIPTTSPTPSPSTASPSPTPSPSTASPTPSPTTSSAAPRPTKTTAKPTPTTTSATPSPTNGDDGGGANP